MSRRDDVLAAAGGALAALVPALALYGFTVDDALITCRYAAHIAQGLGYRFNAAGPVTDGVTPLGFPYLLAPFAGGGPLAALAAAKVIGVAAWTIAAAALTVAIGRLGGTRARFGALLLLVFSFPLAAWSAAGMETGLALALGALAVALPELGLVRAGAACAGLTAWLRPETLPWALVIAGVPAPKGRQEEPFGRREDGGEAIRVRIQRLALAAAPFLVVTGVRLAVFGRVVPLSVLAKPSDAAHGGFYALVCFLFTGPPVLLAPFAVQRLGGWGRGLCAAVVIHLAAIGLAGGDWMPLGRLCVPALPTVILAAARLANAAPAWSTAARLSLALAGQIFQLTRFHPDDIAGVGARRREVIEALRPSLADARVVAALDVGWLGAATGATIVDLAGLTDPAIAVLPGGHTSKAVPARLLDARGVDAIVLLVKEGEPIAQPWTETFFARIVELRVAAFPGVGDAFTLAAESRVPRLRYVVLRRTAPSPATSP